MYVFIKVPIYAITLVHFAVLNALFAPLLIHQKSLTMNNKHSSQKALHAKSFAASHAIVHCGLETVFRKCLLCDKPPKKQHKV